MDTGVVRSTNVLQIQIIKQRIIYLILLISQGSNGEQEQTVTYSTRGPLVWCCLMCMTDMLNYIIQSHAVERA